MENLAGQRLGNYHLTQLLGQGGFAEVYLGEHIYLDTQAAIKVLRTRLTDEEVEHFRTEARTIARLVHPHIVRVLDFGVDGTVPFLVMDYAPNGTLRKRHPFGSQLPLSTVVSYTQQIADALQYAHDHRIIHRDIKPENILLDKDNGVLVSDFGIALVVSSRSYSTQFNQDLVGTITYMAPEQIQSQAVPASDQYALGIVVYEWLCGTRPFQGSFTEVAVKHALAPLPSLREKLPSIALEVEAVILKALSKNPDDRYARVRDFAIALDEAYQQHTSPQRLTIPDVSGNVSALSTSAATDTVPFSHVETSHVISPPAVVTPPVISLPLTPPVAAPVTNELSFVKQERDAPSTSALEDESKQLVSSSAQPSASKSENASQQLVSSPAQPRKLSRRTVALGLTAIAVASAVGGGVAWFEHTQKPQVATSMDNGTQLYTYTGHSAFVWSAAWSPRSKRVASASSDKTVQVWDALNGGNLYTYTGHADTVYAISWSPDGTRIASASYDKTVQVWDAAGGHPFTYNGHSSWVWVVRWSPDGTRIASAGGDKTVQVWDALRGNHLYTYTGHTGSVFTLAWSPDSKYLASAGADGTVQVWNATNGNAIYTYQPYASPLIWTISWSPDGSRIASAGSDHTVQLWDAVDGGHLFVYYGHSDTVYSVAWSPNGKRIVSAGEAHVAQVWDAADGGNASLYSGHSEAIRSVAWASDNKRIASASWDKTVQIWQ